MCVPMYAWCCVTIANTFITWNLFWRVKALNTKALLKIVVCSIKIITQAKLFEIAKKLYAFFVLYRHNEDVQTKQIGEQYIPNKYEFEARQTYSFHICRYAVCNFVGNQVNGSTITNFQYIKWFTQKLECTYIDFLFVCWYLFHGNDFFCGKKNGAQYDNMTRKKNTMRNLKMVLLLDVMNYEPMNVIFEMKF